VEYARASNVVETAAASGENAGIAHPAMYSIALPSFFMQAFSDECEPWLDPFLGSGTTLIAADQLDRICYGIEIAPKYCDVIIKRYINHAGSDEHVAVERNGKRLSWQQAQRKMVKVI
jgi:DNA modification methylase